VTYPDLPNSRFVFDTTVQATGPRKWSTEIHVTGEYDGPTEIVSVRDYQVRWRTDGKSLIERGRAVLQTATGQAVRTEWQSVFVPKRAAFDAFPKAGEVANVEYSPFHLNGNTMSYEWHGTVEALRE
jgi:hypothetical protein